MTNCPHNNVRRYERMVSCATLREQDEWLEWGICLDCGEMLDASDIPDDAEITEGEYELPARGMPDEFYD